MNKTELKYNVMKTGSYFFDRSSMKFFGDTMKNYYVPKNPVNIQIYTGETVKCWELQRINPVKHGIQESAFFSCVDFSRVHKVE